MEAVELGLKKSEIPDLTTLVSRFSEDVFDISSSTTSEDTAEFHDEDITDESYHRKPGVPVYNRNHHNSQNHSEYRNIQQQHYQRQQRYSHSHSAYGGYYSTGKLEGSSNNYQGNQAHSKSFDKTGQSLNRFQILILREIGPHGTQHLNFGNISAEKVQPKELSGTEVDHDGGG